jgi:uncharacterized protein
VGPAATPVFLSLNDLPLRAGERLERVYSHEMGPVILGGVSFQIVLPQGVTVVVDRIVGGFLVTVSADARAYGPCARCLCEAALTVCAEQQEFAPTAKDGWEESELSDFIDDMVVDVMGIAREAVVLALPAQVLCSPTCRGLCPRCGHDLNHGDCECPPPETDIRWEKLKQLEVKDEFRP